MPPRRRKEIFKQLTVFVQDRIIGLQEEGFSYHAIAACAQRNSSKVTRVWKQWRTRETGRGRRKVTSALDDRRLIRMAVNDRTVFSMQLATCWSTVTSVLMWASWIRRRMLQRGLHAMLPYTWSPLKANYLQLRLQWAHKCRARQADWNQVAFSHESHFNLLDHVGHVRVWRYTGERCLSK